LQLGPCDVALGQLLHDGPRNRREETDDRAVEDHYRSRMKPWRAAETSATASGKSTRMASRRAIACSSALPTTWIWVSAEAVSSTAVFRVNVANCSRCASCTDSACCSANSRRPRRRSSGSPPRGNPKLPSISGKHRKRVRSRARGMETAGTLPQQPVAARTDSAWPRFDAPNVLLFFGFYAITFASIAAINEIPEAHHDLWEFLVSLAFFSAFVIFATLLAMLAWRVPSGLATAMAVAMVPAVGFGFTSLVRWYPKGTFFDPTQNFSGAVFAIVF